jgi:hypothetical protein
MFPGNEKERRTKDAQRTPAKGHSERTLADAPFGARAQGADSLSETWRFSLKQRLDAHASIQVVTIAALTRDGMADIIQFNLEETKKIMIMAADAGALDFSRQSPAGPVAARSDPDVREEIEGRAESSDRSNAPADQ